MTQRKAFETNNLSNRTREHLDKLPIPMAIEHRGVQGDNLLEAVPSYIRRAGDKIVEGANNTIIVLGRDRPGEVGSGYGATTGAGAIDIVAGRMSSNIQTSALNDQSFSGEPLSADPNIALDASRIYISQKTDVDSNFNIAEGKVGFSKARAAIAIKSDAIRIIGREGVKIVTKVDTHNSRGGGIISVPSIDLIAGNDDSELEPAVKGKKIIGVLSDIYDKISELNQVLDSFMTAQIEFNSSVMIHDHIDPVLITLGINGGKVVISPELVIAGTKTIALQQISKNDGVMNNIKTTVAKASATEIHGADYPLSTNVNIT